MNQATLATQTAPPEAFRFDSAPVVFVTSDSAPQEDEHRVEIMARTPGIVNHWYWGRMIHDMAGCRHKDTLPLDWRHDPDEIIGYVDAVTADDNGLSVSALVQSLERGDRASTIIRRGRKKTPYEASIHWDEWDNLLEYLDKGFVATVNGLQVEGPLVIAREWTLRGIAITPYGVDSTTNTQFSAGSSVESIPVSLQPFKDAMSKETTSPAATTADKEPTKDSAAQTQPAGAKAEQKPAPPADAHRDAARGELARYMERFGTERGAEYFRDSVDYGQACEREIDFLRKQLATRDSELATERGKIQSLSLGEQAPVDTGATKDSAATPTWASQFKKAGS